MLRQRPNLAPRGVLVDKAAKSPHCSIIWSNYTVVDNIRNPTGHPDIVFSDEILNGMIICISYLMMFCV